MAKQANGTVKALSSEDCIALEDQYGAHNYHPLRVVFDKGSGARVWDPEGIEYIDFLSAYSAVNQGHCHPRIVAALVEQASKLTLSSRAFHASGLGAYAEKITKLMQFDSVLPMNTGAEAVETALKLARKWAYVKKGVPENKAVILSVTENFHGRTIGIVSMSTDPDARNDFGPYLPNVGPICPADKSRTIRFGHAEDLEAALKAHGPHVAAFLVEPIQGEAGIVIPPDDYLRKCQALCRQHNVLLICDEVQSGLGRTGKMAAFQHDPEVKPDILTLGKALGGGIYPVSAVLSSREIMLCIKPGQHGSTFGGNPLACAVASASLDVIVEEQLCERAAELGQKLLAMLEDLKAGSNGWITAVRGKGLFAAVVMNESKSKRGRGAWQLCELMKSRGVLAKPTHVNIIRLAPPLVISEADLQRGVDVIRQCLADLDTIDVIPGEQGHPEESNHHNQLDD